jgi:ELWxxDGT repeat protein
LETGFSSISTSGAEKPTDVNGRLYFRARASGDTQDKLWLVNAAATDASVIEYVHGPTDPVTSPTNLTSFQNKLYFTFNDGSLGTELWSTDGTAASTQRVKDINVGGGGANPNKLTVAGSLLFFVATDSAANTKLWKSDGTSLGTAPVRFLGIQPLYNPDELVAVGSTLYTTAKISSTDPPNQSRLWKTDGATTALVKYGPTGTELEVIGATGLARTRSRSRWRTAKATRACPRWRASRWSTCVRSWLTWRSRPRSTRGARSA